MTNEKEKEVEKLAQIFANKRHSSIEWGRECARIVIEAGYRSPELKPDFEQSPSTAIKWPEKRTPDKDSVYLDYDKGYNHGRMNCIDAYQQSVKEAGVRKVRYPKKKDAEHTCKEGCPGCNCEGANAAIDEMRRLNEERGEIT